MFFVAVIETFIPTYLCKYQHCMADICMYHDYIQIRTYIYFDKKHTQLFVMTYTSANTT